MLLDFVREAIEIILKSLLLAFIDDFLVLLRLCDRSKLILIILFFPAFITELLFDEHVEGALNSNWCLCITLELLSNRCLLCLRLLLLSEVILPLLQIRLKLIFVRQWDVLYLDLLLYYRLRGRSFLLPESEVLIVLLFTSLNAFLIRLVAIRL